MNYLKQSKAFTIPEALIILLIATLLAVAGAAVITKKHRDVEVHGRWTCTMDGNGVHWVKSEMDGKSTGWVNAGSSCTFTPPANGNDFLIKAVAGGGSGAGGQSGEEEKIYDSDADSDTFVTSIKEDGYYTVYGVGGGGGGGGMSCGEASKYYSNTINAVKTFDRTYAAKKDSDWTWDVNTQSPKPTNKADEWNITPTNYADSSFQLSSPYVYGYVDMAIPGFDYDLLVKNDKKYSPDHKLSDSSVPKVYWTDEKYNSHGPISMYDFKYKYISNYDESNFKNLFGCFASDNVPFADYYKKYGSSDYIRGLYQQDPDKGQFICWNLPGKGGKAAGSFSANNVYISGGQNLVINVGRAGKGQRDASTQTVGLYKPNNTTKSNFTAYTGGAGTDGTDTTLYAGGTNHYTASGGAGGYGRVLKTVNYKNIPVYECEVVKKEGTFANNPSCPSSGWDSSGSLRNSCSSKPGCNASRYLRFTSCSGGGSCSGKGESSCAAGYDTTDAAGNPVHHSCTSNYDYYTSCTTGTHIGPVYEETNCRIVVRKTYFDPVQVCVNTSAGSADVSEIEAEIPGIFGTERSIKRFWIGDLFTTQDATNYSGPYMKHGEDGYGSGGYGIGESAKTYFEYEDEANTGNGTFTARLYGWDGEEGYASISRISYTAGGGGQAGQYASTILKKTGKLTVTVGKGGFPGSFGLQGEDGGKTVITKEDGSILLSLDGGKAGLAKATEAKMSAAGILSGIRGALSPFESIYNKAKVIPYGGKDGTNTSFDGVSPSTEKWCGTGGCTGPLVITYGAGGGGGAASKDKAGAGGAGTAGAVVIEW